MTVTAQDMSKNTNSLCLSCPLCSIISSVSCHLCSLCAYVFIFSGVMLLELSCYTWYLIIPPDLRGSMVPLFSRSIFHPLCSFYFASHFSLFLSLFKKRSTLICDISCSFSLNKMTFILKGLPLIYCSTRAGGGLPGAAVQNKDTEQYLNEWWGCSIRLCASTKIHAG